MSITGYLRPSAVVLAIVLAALLAPLQMGTAQGQGVVGNATGMRATVSGILGTTTTELASTGWLANTSDARAVSMPGGAIPSVGEAETPTASTISSIYGWDASDEVSSAASLANLAVTVAGSRITAAFAIAQATAPVGAVGTGWSSLEGLAVNGVPIAVTGTVSETITLGAVRIVVNEVLSSASGITVNALHISSLDGQVDVVVASATAGIR